MSVSGHGIGHGCAIGRLKFYRRAEPRRRMPVRTRNAKDETDRLHSAIGEAAGQLEALYIRTRREAGDNEAQIFEIHRMLLDDEDFIDEAETLIREGYSASYAVSEAAEHFGAIFSAMEDEYLSARAADLRDVASRVAGIIDGTDDTGFSSKSGDEKFIIAADDLSPSETVRLDRDSIAGFVTFSGSPNSHTAILARALGIPALIATGKIGDEYDDTIAVIDSESGMIFLSPAAETLTRYRAKISESRAAERRLEQFRGVPSLTKSGRKIKLYANIGSPAEARLAREHDAEGIGLLRSEFLYLGETDYPDEDKLFTAYRDTAIAMDGRAVIIRTLDIGADKRVDYFNLEKEENPALGVRGVRLTLARRELFRTQLRALCRASAYGNISVMLPMIVSIREVRECRALLREVQNELRQQSKTYDPEMKLGIMIETPAAALMSDELAREVDFFSVGTNDLIQYTIAADRQNPGVAELCKREREPVLRLIKLAAENAHAAGIWIGVCGELAADTTLTSRYMEMGIDELSVSPPYVLPLRAAIRQCE